METIRHFDVKAGFATTSYQYPAIPDGRLRVLTKEVHCVYWNLSPSLFSHCGVPLSLWYSLQCLPPLLDSATERSRSDGNLDVNCLKCATSLLRSLPFGVSTRCEEVDRAKEVTTCCAEGFHDNRSFAATRFTYQASQVFLVSKEFV